MRGDCRVPYRDPLCPQGLAELRDTADIGERPVTGKPQHLLNAASGEWENTRLAMPDAEVRLYTSFFSQQEADTLLAALTPEAGEIHWKQEKITLYGKTHNIPRLTAWYGDPDNTYSYSGITVEASAWTPTLLNIKQAIEAVSDVRFNSVLLNLYRDESDGVAWHSDDEKTLGKNPVIGSVSLGAVRDFQMKHKTQTDNEGNKPATTIRLEHGSYLLMQGPTQHHWVHRIPRSNHPMGPRINLTFRVVAQTAMLLNDRDEQTGSHEAFSDCGI